jgi:hypothetical protein
MVTVASPTINLIISVIKPIISLVLISLRKRMTKQADNHRGKMLGETKSVLPVITDKYKNADMGKDIKEIIGEHL